MDGFDRIYDLHRILSQARFAVPLGQILEKMECSRATFNRVKRHMAEFLGAPIIYDRSEGGYRYQSDREGQYELPGTWFNQQEIYALVLMQSLLEQAGSGLLSHQLAPIRQRFDQLLSKSAITPDGLSGKIRLLNINYRNVPHHHFDGIAHALLTQLAMQIEYAARSTRTTGWRDISPQRLLCYRGNWYLDAWCHQRQALRTFALECIKSIKPSTQPFNAIADQQLDEHFTPSYGIFSGPPTEVAKLRIAEGMAHRVRDELWHPQQTLEEQADGSIVLSIPFRIEQPEELIRDVLGFGEQLQVIAPPALRQLVTQKLTKALTLYPSSSQSSNEKI